MKKKMKIFVITATALVAVGAVGAIAVGTNGFKDVFAWDNFAHTAASLTIDNTDLSKKAVTPNLDFGAPDAALKTVAVTGLGKEFDEDYIRIPETVAIGGVVYTVTGIAENAYLGGGHVLGVYVPGTVTSIGMNAFQDDDYVRAGDDYVSGQTLKKIQFSSDSKIAQVDGTAADGTTKYGFFEKLYELRGVVAPTGLTSVGYHAFFGDESLQSFAFGAKVAAVGESAFGGCASLKEVGLSDAVASIGASSFASSGLAKFVGGTGLAAIGAQAFKDCHALKQAILRGGTLASVGDGAFDNAWYSTIYTNNPTAALFTEAANPEKCPVYVLGQWSYSNGSVGVTDGAKPANSSASSAA